MDKTASRTILTSSSPYLGFWLSPVLFPYKSDWIFFPHLQFQGSFWFEGEDNMYPNCHLGEAEKESWGGCLPCSVYESGKWQRQDRTPSSRSCSSWDSKTLHPKTRFILRLNLSDKIFIYNTLVSLRSHKSFAFTKLFYIYKYIFIYLYINIYANIYMHTYVHKNIERQYSLLFSFRGNIFICMQWKD